ncbi:SusE domain-containing protein [Mucilaginibacter sp. UR6-1]|uniref:SusE domain-containing protein n=1 Tax=Mucilaginibacter sp. UR6-1 TaxID=1435643 RepID=UPI001E3D6653|nr:SusE domain-containing protein [Mucilaginibacter sp. UR6-1]MCC8410670.1 SusE domain-containing protein [Mucilaginibacter sp. UR6-1]
MRTHIIKSLFIAMAVLVMQACKKDTVMVKSSTEGTASTLKASATDVQLSSETAADNAVTFTWNKADYGYNAAVLYTLQIDKKGNKFASAREYALDGTAALEQKFTVGDLNNALVLMGLTPGAEAELEVRVKSELRTNVDTLFSNVIAVKATPYAVIVNYPSLYVPAAYQGWTPATAEKIASVLDNKEYEGYINFADAANLIFKITTDVNWTTTYGWASSTNTDSWAGGTFAAGASGNLFVPSTGYYRLIANTKNNTWEAQKTTFGIIGDATPGGWNSDTNMSFNTTTKEWTVTANLTVGKIKFRANSSWDINYGDNAPANGFLKQNGADIPVTSAGRYTIVLNLSIPGNYTYSITKN